MKHLIRTSFLLLLAVMLLICMALPAFAQSSTPKNKVPENAKEIQEAGVSGNLNKDTDVRWYSFAVTVEGDAVIMFNSNGGSSEVANWEIFIYDQDKTTVLENQYARKGITYVSAQNLSKGTYYVQVQAAKSATHNKFSSKQFSIHAITCSSTQPDTPSNEIRTVTKPGTLLWQVNGTLFIKAYDGEALVGSYTNSDGETGPVLVGKNVDNVAFFSSKCKWIATGHHKSYINYGETYDTKRYFISPDSGFVELSKDDTPSAPLYQCGNGRKISAKHAAKELLNVHNGKDPNEGLALENFMASPAFPIIAIAVVVLIVAIILVVHIFNKTNRSKHVHKVGDYPHSSSTDSSTSSSDSGADWNGMPHVIDYNSVKDM